MDLLLFFIGLIMLYKGKLPWMFAIIILLASTYLQIPFTQEQLLKFGPEHNVRDVGLALYLCFLIREFFTKGIYLDHSRLQKAVIFLGVFLFLSGIHDIFNNVLIGDVIRYLKSWAYLTIVFMKPNFTYSDLIKTIKIIFWITFAFCLILTLQQILGFVWIGKPISYISNGITHDRGVKPPSYAIICSAIAIFNIFGYNYKIRTLTSLIFILPIILTLKMTYFSTVVLILILYYITKNKTDLTRILKISILGGFAVMIIFVVSPTFQNRFCEMLEQTQTVSSKNQKEGTFTYRINHFQERFDYVIDEPTRALRGIGYVQERNFHKNIFKLGQPNNWGELAQLDTGDIAWSILIVRLGLIGIFFYLIFYLVLCKSFWESKNLEIINLLWLIYLLTSLFIMSLGNTIITDSEFFIIPLLINIANENRTLHLKF